MSSTPAPSVFQQGLIAFSIGHGDGSDAEVQVIAADGRVVATVPRSGFHFDDAPAWEPAGTSLVIDSARGGKIHLFRYSVETKAVTQLTFGDRFEGYPDVSPDGSTIAVDYGGEGADLGIWLMDIDGSNRRNLVPPPPAPAVDSAPAFSPDGSK
ncbi:MAG: PD40 domain-containing protein, partial [Chloroflexi bacterium]|nr:PD40 domain-containing protein [Chloroflexota bacterium]